MAAGETIVDVVSDAPWLPAGGRAETVRSRIAPIPAGLVRLLVLDGKRIYCQPRSDSGKIDLPTGSVSVDDPDGSRAAAALAQRVFGEPVHVTPIGFVRNIVPTGADDYLWPTPVAHFTVWTAAGEPCIPGTWIDTSLADNPLESRHWWPLIDERHH
ncbi:hypothetical protein GCM10011575_33260 [Microlunatus endophyticus]|uniref:Uncharacterized protein n=1 Tax=Microlunatus endophyticus TaxID=1716077 RepID=A0A917SEW6_9ACTN|nr:NUDIX hydrolase [Microlunatus endophyticus]GGL72221.1 hypothetical protein GCM10011575_33260 [Microlunatus endophyticus]